MSTILFHDVETSGLPNWKVPSDDPSQPHLIEVAAVLCDEDSREIIATINTLVKPEEFEISDEITELTGITTDEAMSFGVSEQEAVEMLLAMRGDTRIAHNRTFDQRMIRIALKRYFDADAVDKWAEKDDFLCTMLMAKPIMQLPGSRGYKNPKLSEAYAFFTGKELVGGHRAMADTMACMEVYFAIKDGVVDAVVNQ